MFGMVCVLFSTAAWLILATFKGLPVSTTHSCIGGIIGMTVVCKGFKAVNWKGVGMVFASWIIAPVISGFLSTTLFVTIRKTILRASNSLQRAFRSYAPIVGFTIGFNVFLILYNSESLGIDLPMHLTVAICLGIAMVVALVVQFTALPSIRRHVEAEGTIGLLTEMNDVMDLTMKDGKIQTTEMSGDLIVEKQIPESVMNETTLIAEAKNDATVEEMHKNAEQFDPATEKLFSYLQVITAVFNSFAHGANDVSNSIGPLAACLTIYQTGDVMQQAKVPTIALVIGGVGIVLGLVCLGYKVMASMGVNMVTVTPSRGFTIELGAALIILMGSAFGIPLSTTHCKVGSTVGVGIAEGKNGVNWKLLYGVFAGWIITLVICALTTGLLFAIVVRFIE